MYVPPLSSVFIAVFSGLAKFAVAPFAPAMARTGSTTVEHLNEIGRISAEKEKGGLELVHHVDNK